MDAEIVATEDVMAVAKTLASVDANQDAEIVAMVHVMVDAQEMLMLN